ncbi:MAG: hypothetical protein WCG29_12055 [Desulfomonile sp.]|jgi:hypothetical protein|nr:hypothetical protein [Deltaproteobacteria bacterium]
MSMQLTTVEVKQRKKKGIRIRAALTRPASGDCLIFHGFAMLVIPLCKAICELPEIKTLLEAPVRHQPWCRRY